MRPIRLVPLLVTLCAACGDDSPTPTTADDAATDLDADLAEDANVDTDSADGTPEPGAPATVWYTVGDEVFRISAEDGAVPENLSQAMAENFPGTRDRWIAGSADGQWLVLSSDRFGCGGECLVRVRADLSEGAPVLAGGAEVYVEGNVAVTAAGDTIVFAARSVGHETDLFATRLTGDAWSAPALLTRGSSFAYNNMPALSRSGTAVHFDCGDNPYPEDGANAACVVGLDGTGLARVLGPDALPDARFDKVQNPHEGPAGLFFEASWPVDGDAPELIWLSPAGGGAPEPIGRAFPNAVSPCAFADGRFVFLWLGRPGNDAGLHELVLADADGSLLAVLTPDVDVADIGLGCGP
jgi:hypothetical protein